jgi:hypothetical protein
MMTTGGLGYQEAPPNVGQGVGAVNPGVPVAVGSKPQKPSKRRRVRPKGGKGKGKGGDRGRGRGNGSQKPQNPYAQFKPQVSAAAQMQFGPASQALRTQGQNIAPFFQQYLNQLETSRVAQSAYYDGAMAASQQNAQQAGASTGLTANSDLAAQVREGMLGAFTELLRAQGASYNALKEDQKVVGAASQLSAQTQNQQAKTDLKTQKGAFKVDYAEQLRQRAHTENLENAAFGLDAAEVKAGVKSDRADRRQDKREARRDRRDKNREVITSGPFSGYTKAEVRKLSPAEKDRLRKESSAGSPEKKDSTFSPKEKAGNRVKLRSMISKVRANDNGVASYGQDTVRAMIDAGVDPVLARAAVARALGKPVPSWVRRRLKQDYGITVSANGKKVSRPKPDDRGTGNTGNTGAPSYNDGEKRPN